MLKTINNDKIYHDQFNALAYQNKNGVLSGCVVTAETVNNLYVEVASGSIFFGDDTTNVIADTVGPFVTPDLTNQRMDLVAVNTSGTLSIISGETLKHPTDPRPPVYDPDTYIILARILFAATDSAIATANIKNMIVLNEGGAGSTTDALLKYTESLDGSLVQAITHDLSDLVPIVQVYNSSNEQITPDIIDITDEDTVTLTFNTTTAGEVCIVGGIDTNNAIKKYTSSFTSATTTTVTHSLSDSVPLVQVYDDDNEQITPGRIDVIDANTVLVELDEATTGNVIVYGGDDTYGFVSRNGSVMIGALTSPTITFSPRTSYPDANEGAVFYNSNSSDLNVYNGTSWQVISVKGDSSILNYSTGTELDCAADSGAGVSSTSGIKVISLSAGDLANYDYIEIKMNGAFTSFSREGGTWIYNYAKVELVMENTTPTPDEFILSTTTVVIASEYSNGDDGFYDNDRCQTFNKFYELSANDKLNGVELQITTLCTQDEGTAEYSNREVVVKGH